MDIVNIEKLDLSKPIVLTGRNEHVRAIAKELKAKLYYAPRDFDHFTDYPAVVKELQECLECEKGTVIITTQNAEFLDCLLESELDFAQVTVRRYDDDKPYRLRVLSKEDAWEYRQAYNMELRI